MPTNPRLTTSHELNPIKGWPSQTAVDFSAKLSANVTVDPVYAGRVGHLNSDGEIELGLPDDDLGAYMALFLFQNSDDPDVRNYGGNPAEFAGAWVAAAPSGNLMGLVAAGAYELETTEFDQDEEYAPNDALTSPDEVTAEEVDINDAGLLMPGVVYTNHICGVVSRGVRRNCHGRLTLSFWPVWLPRTPQN